MSYVEGPEGLFVPERIGGRLIATDHDETVVDHLGALNAYINGVLETRFTVQDYTQPYYHLTWGVPKERGRKLVDDFHQTPEFHNLAILSDAAIGVPAVAAKNTLIVVTGRHMAQVDSTISWYNAHLPNMIRSFHFTSHYVEDDSVPEMPKSKVCLDLGVDIIIEDLTEHAIKCALSGITAILLDKPWNQDLDLPPNVIRVRDYEAAADYIDQLPPKDL